MLSEAQAPDQPIFFSGVKELGYRAMHNPADYLDADRINTPEFYRSEIPAVGGVSNARGLARFFGALAEGGVLDGSRILHPETVALANTVESDGIDEVFKLPTRFGLGFQLTRPAWPFGPGARTFGHGGGGGSLGFADPDARVGFGYATNRLLWGPTRSDPRWAPLFDALYDALG